MTAGIYRATFSDGSIYIGKSVNIDTRWKQHIDDMLRGKHTKRMQQAYNLYGLPNFDLLTEAHKDHLDILEGYFIQLYKDYGKVLLNSDKVEPPSEDDKRVIKAYADKFLLSTADHIRMIANLEHESLKNSRTIKKLEKELKAANEVAEVYESDNVYIDARYREDLKLLKLRVKELTEEIKSTNEQLRVQLQYEANTKPILDKIKNNWFLSWFI